jgi:acetyl-CoA carboxylase carboxyl transferase subunit alpha
MLEHSIYSVISPEGCAAILWRSSEHRERAAEALKLTSEDLVSLGVCDEVVPEPAGGAHSDCDLIAEQLREVLVRHLRELEELDTDELIRLRHAKYEAAGAWNGESGSGKRGGEEPDGLEAAV